MELVAFPEEKPAGEVGVKGKLGVIPSMLRLEASEASKWRCPAGHGFYEPRIGGGGIQVRDIDLGVVSI